MPMRALERPIITSAATRVRLRPIRSPKCPNSMPPTGRAMKPTAKVENEASRATRGERLAAKNSLGKTSAAAVP